jgi:protein involved in polysaccharide export with SLBB domain
MRVQVAIAAVVLFVVGTIAGTTVVVAQDAAKSPAPLKPGDEVEVVVTVRARVAADGSLSVPGVGKVDAAGRSLDSVRASLADAAAKTDVGCEVRRVPPRTVAVIGALQATVELSAGRSTRLLEVLAKAGDLGRSRREAAVDFTHVKIRRVGTGGTPFTLEVDVDDILERGHDEQNVTMFENDIVIVPRSTSAPQSGDWVYVSGAVGIAGRMPIVHGTTAFTITKLLALSGDFKVGADRAHVEVVRMTATGRIKIEVDVDAIIEGHAPDFELQPDDLIVVHERR